MEIVRWSPAWGIRIMFVAAVASLAVGYIIGRNEYVEKVRVYSSANHTLMDSLTYYRLMINEKEGEIAYWRGIADGCIYKISRIKRICEE